MLPLINTLYIGISQHEDAAYDDDGVEVSVAVSVGAVVGVGVSGQAVSLGVGLWVGLVVGPPPPHFPRLLGSPSVL